MVVVASRSIGRQDAEFLTLAPFDSESHESLMFPERITLASIFDEAEPANRQGFGDGGDTPQAGGGN